jgi:hypothetical protein
MATRKLSEGEHAVRLRIVLDAAVPGVHQSAQGRENTSVGAQDEVEAKPLAFQLDVCASV